MAIGPREGRVLHAMSIDDAYEVQRVLSSGPGGRTEVVAIDGFGPYLRKKIPSSLVDRRVWTALSECSSLRLPHVVATYETPDEFVVVCDFVPGDTLHEIVSARGRLPVSAHCAGCLRGGRGAPSPRYCALRHIAAKCSRGGRWSASH